MKVALVDWDYAYPLNSGKRLRTTNLMLALAKDHDITYVSRGNEHGSEGRESRDFLGDHGIQTAYLDSPIPPKSGIGYFGRIAKNLLSTRPYAVDVHCSPDFRKAYRQFASTHAFDLWQFEWTPYSTMLEGIAGVRRLVVAHNVDSLIWKRYAETDTRPAHKIYIRQQYRRFAKFEKQAFASADRVVSVSGPDAELMRQMFDIDHVDVVDNGVDVQRYGAVERKPVPGRILFLGSLDWRPNQDAIRLLLDDIFPKVRQQRGHAELHIVGRKPPTWMVESCRQIDGVKLHVDVPDVFPYLEESAVMTIPLRIGGGSRLKMIESLAAGLPVVASRVAAEGLDFRPETDYWLADNADEMVARLVQSIDDPVALDQTAITGKQTAAANYGWDKLGAKLYESWQRCLGHSVEAAP